MSISAPNVGVGLVIAVKATKKEIGQFSYCCTCLSEKLVCQFHRGPIPTMPLLVRQESLEWTPQALRKDIESPLSRPRVTWLRTNCVVNQFVGDSSEGQGLLSGGGAYETPQHQQNACNNCSSLLNFVWTVRFVCCFSIFASHTAIPLLRGHEATRQ